LFAEKRPDLPCGERRSVTAVVINQRLASSLLASLLTRRARAPPQAEIAWDEPA
jgi:hypothetical protein